MIPMKVNFRHWVIKWTKVICHFRLFARSGLGGRSAPACSHPGMLAVKTITQWWCPKTAVGGSHKMVNFLQLLFSDLKIQLSKTFPTTPSPRDPTKWWQSPPNRKISGSSAQHLLAPGWFLFFWLPGNPFLHNWWMGVRLGSPKCSSGYYYSQLIMIVKNRRDTVMGCDVKFHARTKYAPFTVLQLDTKTQPGLVRFILLPSSV